MVSFPLFFLFIIIASFWVITSVEVYLVADHEPGHATEHIHEIDRIYTHDSDDLVEDDPPVVVGVLPEGHHLAFAVDGFRYLTCELKLNTPTY